MLNTYEQERKRELDAKAILLQQRIEGRAEALLAVAKLMLEQGWEVEKIIQFTNLSKQEIQAIDFHRTQ